MQPFSCMCMFVSCLHALLLVLVSCKKTAFQSTRVSMQSVDGIVPTNVAAMKHSEYGSVPYFGLGTYKARDDQCIRAVCEALKAGYRLVDTASAYKNEHLVAEGIKLSGVPREEIFITTKLSMGHQGEEKARQCVMQSLEQLQTTYVDLFLIHWPGAKKTQPTDPKNMELRHGSWRALQALQQEGKIRHIGVSNFNTRHLEALISSEGFLQMPLVNQVEFHPFCQQQELLEYCSSRGISLQAYASMGQGSADLVEHTVIQSVAAKHRKSAHQILLKWGIQKGVPVIPKSVSQERIQHNANVFDFELDLNDMAMIADLDINHHFCWDSSNVY